ncbi:MAG: glycosyltransferase [Paludibacterium sp.]|uniref:glycosyltransferase n=1 Tax=Paludibacterium sp. TaxID=1917523 RepID=UPI0025F6CA6F|nr:glycosyltransferase [Paludibacterium sp.]MBV8045718.1 glycosyltransferase [Paludibacterium sp.]MBV8467916.1 glycosyltransferase [Burkholderiales bacterium]
MKKAQSPVVIVDLRTWPWTGIGRVTRGIFQCARELEAEFEIQYVINDDTVVPDGLPNLVRFRSLPFGRGEQMEFRRLFARLGDRRMILHSLNFNVPLLLPKRVRQIAHFYDVLIDTGEFRTPLHRLAYNAYVWSLRRHRATILAQSDYTAQQIAKHHPFHEVIVCPHGYRNYMEPREADLKAAYGLERPYFLYIGLNKPRKNLDGLLAAYGRALQANPAIAYDLVVCGPIFDRTSMGFDIRAAVDADPLLAGRVHLLGFIPEEHLYAIYRQASLYVVPSHLESGYSYPALEALTTGTPVLLNKVDMYNYASESGGVFFFDGSRSTGSESLADVLAKMLACSNIDRIDPAQCDVLHRFSWERVRDTMKALYGRP